jgi:hypothetical protein
VKRRLLTDWVSLGLLDSPLTHGRGRGRGVGRSWPEEQAELFLILLKKRLSLRTVTPLANVPVFTWLVWGDRWVPLRQARKALATWTGAHSRVSSTRARRTARELVRQVAGPRARRDDKRQLVDLIERFAGGAPLDEAALQQAVARLLPEDGRLFARGYAQLVQCTIEAALKLDAVEDDVFELARASYQTSAAAYLASGPATAADANATPRIHEEVVNSACRDLLTQIGIQLRAGTTTKEMR